jgi:hypothetical protein
LGERSVLHSFYFHICLLLTLPVCMTAQKAARLELGRNNVKEFRIAPPKHATSTKTC